MAENKEPSLNNSYYGPPIPPQQSHRRSGRAIPPGCKPYRLLCFIFKAITLVLIVLGIIVLILWLIFQPRDLHVYVENAQLARFDLAQNHTLYYDLALNMSIRNPNKAGLYYERVEAFASYDGSRFGYQSLPKFHQPRKSTVALHPSFQGQNLVLGNSVNGTFDREKGEGFFHISIKINTKVRLKMIVIQSAVYVPEVDCYLRLPVPSNITSVAAGFTRTECSVGSFS
ncbi:NDR1/HIN1-like protein 10 [Phoenix dactylifera]|uniref:NDR1/HIN1-like protein 10 n=1 Tax=Phoenix dactylifera TaxID=42345 RepID=A0A8B7MVG7_PHODC|nr:NDR1/HIN1-like protein 10 [Phoenix dactylifera]